MTTFEPVPFQVVDSPEQLKAFTDPLRVRVLAMIRDRAATNQQIADALEESQAKVLYHVRFLLDAGLIRLVETRIKGGNVEKYYRATARMFGVRPGSDLVPDIVGAEFELVRAEVAASTVTWPDQPVGFEIRKARLAPARAAEFHRRLLALIQEYWGGPQQPPAEDPDADLLAFASVTYRDPTAPHAGRVASSSPDGERGG